MRVALAAHDDVLRKTIEAHGGFLFKHTGDALCATFASPRSAVDAAVAAQRTLELPVRIGIATGEAELRDGDYFGAVLNRVARTELSDETGGIEDPRRVSRREILQPGRRRLGGHAAHIPIVFPQRHFAVVDAVHRNEPQ
jgi:class 3 adenylate cyclase